LSSLASYFKTVYEVSLMKGSEKEVAVALGLKEYAVRKTREQASKLTSAQLLSVYGSIYSVISEVKCGEITPSSALKKVIAVLFFAKS